MIDIVSFLSDIPESPPYFMNRNLSYQNHGGGCLSAVLLESLRYLSQNTKQKKRYGKFHDPVGEILRELRGQRGVEMSGGDLMSDHIHQLRSM